jgi:DNA-binding NtrC family response regulator
VVVVDADIAVGESIALLLRLKGFSAIHMQHVASVELMLEHWKPQALLVDTRLGKRSDFRFVRNAASDPAFCSTLMGAMTNITPVELPETISRIGFDGLCRRPCPVWRLADLLNVYFAPRRR